MLYGDIEGRLGGGGPTVIDDFESGDLSNWANDTNTWEARNVTAIEGNWLAYCTTGNDEIYYDSTSLCSRGNSYRCRVHPATTSDGALWFYIAATGTDTFPTQSYALRYRSGNDDITIYKWSGGSSTWLANTSYSSGFDPGTEYWFEIDYPPTGGDIIGRAYDSSGTELISANGGVDDEYTSGTVGVDSRFGGNGRVDYFTERSL